MIVTITAESLKVIPTVSSLLDPMDERRLRKLAFRDCSPSEVDMGVGELILETPELSDMVLTMLRTMRFFTALRSLWTDMLST